MTGFTDQEDADYRSGNIGHAVDMIFREMKSAPEGELDPRIVRHLRRLMEHPAIATYESAQPVVPSDEELESAFWGGYNQADDSESRKESLVLAAIRAVRDRLEP